MVLPADPQPTNLVSSQSAREFERHCSPRRASVPALLTLSSPRCDSQPEWKPAVLKASSGMAEREECERVQPALPTLLQHTGHVEQIVELSEPIEPAQMQRTGMRMLVRVLLRLQHQTMLRLLLQYHASCFSSKLAEVHLNSTTL